MRSIPKDLSGYYRSKNRFSQTQGNYQQESVVGIKKGENSRELNRNLENLTPFLFFCREL